MAIRRNYQIASFLLKCFLGSFTTYLYAVVILFASSVTSQKGFLSIDCGSTRNYTDDATGIFWQTDAEYISTGTNLSDIYVYTPAALGAQQFGSLRYFNDPRERHKSDCYVLPTRRQQQYLLRYSFYVGNWTNLIGIDQYDLAFDIYLNSTLLQTIAGLLPISPTNYEIIFHSPGDVIKFCLVRSGGRTSFISSLELRELGSWMYTTVSEPLNGETVYFSLLSRFDLGGSFDHRYPDDAYDRWWSAAPSSYINGTSSEVNGSNLLAATQALAPHLPPVSVMETAIVGNSTTLNVPIGLGSETYVTLFFQDVDGNGTSTNVRGMDILQGDHVRGSRNASEQAIEFSLPVDDPNVTDVFVTLSQASWSRLPPILNAYETHQVERFNLSQTSGRDVDALSALATRVSELQHWEGDPCLPLPYFWLECTKDAADSSIFRVTGLLLDNLNISGSIPKEIFEFKNLSVLSLSHNNLTGSIQDLNELPALQSLSLSDNNFDGSIENLSDLVYLQALYLENNSFSGRVPTFLSSSYLSQLHIDNNHFSGEVPDNIVTKSSRGLNFSYSGNPSLRLSSPSSNSNTGAVAGGIVGGTAGFIVLISIIWYYVTRKKRATSKILKAIRNAGSLRYDQKDRDPGAPTLGAFAESPGFGSLPVFSLQQVSNATQRFSQKIGEGSFGPVYYGRLPGSGQEVAAKVKSGFSRQGLTEFRNELELLSRIHHGNLLSLAGYCEEADQQVLIYNYLCNGSLRDHLSGKMSRQPLDWKTRLRIALESATGLEYLHFHCNPQIIHRDVKSTNILLDKNMVAKVGDFGISKPTLEGMTSGVDTRIMGTPGYIDPEYFISQRLTRKSDVYSFGVVLLEIISGHHPHMTRLEDGAVLSIVEWVKTCVREGNIMDIFDTSMGNDFDYQSAKMVLDLAMESLDPVLVKRPDMRQVLHRLVQAAQLEEAQNPTGGFAPSLGSKRIPPSASTDDFKDSPKRLLPQSGSSSQFSHVSDGSTAIDPR